ncbi:MAG: Oxygen-independent coproporphyrinogen-III oxidase 1 [Spirochaetes bacterium ADurb.Bin218]|jgi:histone acetyltransferase (RNA polymerase elongator complex component)|nr:radical SAM protein [Spirochaetota bacterium]OQA97195.1 MAG: Oxygen-independent coproporphyrinogen-III oxidase 1 [Spirochaetes bacterium ADurb.Bin218]HPX90251.1 radical SAM protein [Spirochaetota bacterium]
MSKRRITIPIFIPHSGCPHCCVFCNQWKVTGSHNEPTEAFFKKTVESYLSTAGPEIERVELAFFGGTFTAIDQELQRKYLSWALPYVTSGSIKSIRISTRPDYIDQNILTFLESHYVETVEIGVQSFDREVLLYSGRGHSREDSLRACTLIKKSGMRLGVQLLPGLPGDTIDKSISSAEITQSLGADDVRIYPAVVLRETELERLYLAGKYKPLSLEEALLWVVQMYEIFYDAKINVIRMGLHPMDFAEGECPIVAGPYHVAFGFLVKSRFRRNCMEKILSQWRKRFPLVKDVRLLIPFEHKEEYIGHKKENINYLKEKFFLTKISYEYTHSSEFNVLEF